MKTFKLLLVCLIITFSSIAQNENDTSKVTKKKGQITITTDSTKVLTEKEIAKKEVLKKIKQFQSNLDFITNKDNDSMTKKGYIELALKDFINNGNGVTIGVPCYSSITNQERIKQIPLIQYLDSLSLQNFIKFEVDTTQNYVSNLIKSGMDVNGSPIFKAIATYCQRFIRYDLGVIKISKDIEKKTVDVEVRCTTDLDGSRWIPLLGDISSIVTAEDTITLQADSVIALNAEDKEIFKQEALKKIKSFQGYLTVIASKDNTIETKKIYKELALDDFINKGKGVIMEVSFLSPKTKQQSIKRTSLVNYLDYLTKLSNTKVELKTATLCYAGNWIKSGNDPSGIPIYETTATYFLEFDGFDSFGNATFDDVTAKTVKVEIHSSDYPGKDFDRIRWLIFIGDISVIEKQEK